MTEPGDREVRHLAVLVRLTLAAVLVGVCLALALLLFVTR